MRWQWWKGFFYVWLLLGLCMPLPARPGLLHEPDSATFSILFGGDTYFGEHEFDSGHYLGEDLVLQKYGYPFSLEHVQPLLNASDLIILNLEMPILTQTSSSPPKVAAGYPVHHGHSGPTETTLAAAGVTAVALGNNHSLDHGVDGLVQTLGALNRIGIGYFGAGLNTMEASRPWHQQVRVGDKTLDLFALNAYAYRKPYDKDFQFYATTGIPGVWLLEKRAMAQQIRELRAGYPQALIIIFPHWGWNYADKDAVQQLLAHSMIQAGADLILGHGAHRLQEIDQFLDRWIIYGLGNFLFNTRGRYDQTQSPPYSLVARLLIEDRGEALAIRLRLYPIVSDNRLVHYQPRPVTLTEFYRVKAFLKGSWPEGADELGYFFELRLR